MGKRRKWQRLFRPKKQKTGVVLYVCAKCSTVSTSAFFFFNLLLHRQIQRSINGLRTDRMLGGLEWDPYGFRCAVKKWNFGTEHPYFYLSDGSAKALNASRFSSPLLRIFIMV